MTIEEKNRIRAHLDELCEWADEQAYSQEDADTIEALENEVFEVREQRDEAFRRLDEMESKLAILVDYLQTMQKYHRSAGTYFMEQGQTEQEEKHGEAFGEVVSVEVMCMKLFDENNAEYVKRRISMYDGLAMSYERRFKT